MKKIMSILLVTAMLLSFGVAFAGCNKTPSEEPAATEGDTTAAAEGGDFVVGLECAYAPFNWTQLDDSNGGVPIDGSSDYAGGYDVEIAKKIAEGLGKNLVIKKTDWDGLIPALQSGMIDAIIAGMSPTADRKESIDFTDNYYKSKLVIVVRKDSPYASAKSIQDFAGAKITAQLNTFHYTVIDQITGVVKQTAMDNFSAMRVSLEAGAIDGYVSERPEGVSASAANDKFAFVEFDEANGFATSEDDVAIAVGINKGREELVAQINEILAGVTEEQRNEIMNTAVANQPAAN